MTTRSEQLSIGATLLENARQISLFAGDLVKDHENNISNQEMATSLMLAAAMVARFFDEDKELMLNMFSLLLDACDALSPMEE